MKRPPQYPKCAHPSGQARIKFRGEQIYLGIWGSPESHLNYQRIVEAWRSGQPLETGRAISIGCSVSEVLAMFIAAAKSGERRTAKMELEHYNILAKAVTSSNLGNHSAANFSANDLDCLRQHMGELEWSRIYIRRECVRFRTCWRWAERKGLLPRGSWEHLRTLQLGTGEVVDGVDPVPDEDLAATIPQLARIPRAMVELQILCAARAGELVRLKPGMIKKTGTAKVGKVKLELGAIWVADFERAHKTGWRGHQKVLFFGPKAQSILMPFLDRPEDAFLFSPLEATREYLATAKRKDGTPVKGIVRRKGGPGDCYSVWSYGDTIERACKRAKVPVWSPGQLRHNAASQLTEEFDPETARIILGHRSLTITRNYVKDSLQKAAKAIEKAG